MKTGMIILMVICAIICFSIAGYMAIYGIPDFEYFLFYGAICVIVAKNSN